MRPCSVTPRSVTPSVFRAVRRLPVLRGLASALACLLALPLCLPFAQAARADAAPAHSALAAALQLQRMEKQAKAHPALPTPSPANRLANTPYVAPRVVSTPALVPASVSAASLPRIAPPRPASVTLLDEVGHSLYPISAVSAKAWKRELAQGSLSNARRALLHLWLGEWELSQQEQPKAANEHFRIAQHLTGVREPLHGLAAYDSAMTLFYRGAYEEAAAQFHRLLMPKTALRGYDRSNCALWYRHTAACAGYHAERAALGIPEPPSLDPLCGAAALAACLRSLGLPSGLHSVLAVCRVSGRGSSVGDIITAGQKLHLQAQPLTADDMGLQLLPKPLVAYVEHDHFVAVTQANAAGVTYLCSDCGPWPGGAVHLTWAQWHALNATIYISVTKPASFAGRQVMEALNSPPEPDALSAAKPRQLAYTGLLSNLHLSLRPHLPFMPSALRGHVVRYTYGGYAACGLTEDALQCLICAQCCPMDDFPNVSPFGDLAGDPVNLANGQEEYSPPTDLTVYNPHGPSISWGRTYQSLRTSPYEADDFGAGWSQPYNISVTDNTASAGYMKGQVHPSANPSYGGNNQSVVAANGTDQPAQGLQWDIVQNGATIATSSNANGWSVYYDTYSGRQFYVTAPSNAVVGTNYEVRYAASSVSGLSGLFDVVTVSSIPQGEVLRIPALGNDSPIAGLVWDIVQNGTTVATSATTHGWQVSVQDVGTALDVQPPFGASLGSGYEARCYFVLAPGRTTYSANFNVIATNLVVTAGQKSLALQNGSKVRFNAPAVPTASQPRVACTLTQSGVPLLIEWDYDATSPYGHYTITWKDRTRWVTTPALSDSNAGNNYILYYTLGQIVDRNGNGITFNYGTYTPFNSGTYSSANTVNGTSDNLPLLTNISDPTTSTALLSIGRDASGAVSSVSDAYGRSVYYHVAPVDYDNRVPQLTQVSQIVPTGTAAPASRYAYGYYTITSHDGYSATRLHTITVPSPTGAGTGTATINYGQDGFVSSLVDSNGNTRTYTQSYSYPGQPTLPPGADANVTTVTVSGPSQTNYSYSVGFDMLLNHTGTTDANGHATYTVNAFDPNNPYRPASVTNGNNNTTTSVWDGFGNLHQMTSPRGTVTNYLYGYPGTPPSVVNSTSKPDAFPMGELLSVKQGSKSPTSYAYYEPSGLVQSFRTPTPGTVGGTATVTTSWTYDALGNVLTMTAPGNNAASIITTTFGYTQDGGYSQTAAIGQPLTVTDNLGKVTHFRYDSRGNRLSVADAISSWFHTQYDFTYNIADQPLQTISPATNQQGSGRTTQTSAYLYPGGPLTGVTTTDETGAAIRQVSYAYGQEGETLGVSGSTEPVTYTYDSQYRLSTLVDGSGHATHYYYKQQGELDAVTYPGYTGPAPVYNATTDDYDNLTGKDSVRFPAYDPNGNLLKRVDGNGVETDYTHSADPQSLLTNIHYVYPAGYTGGTTGDVSLAYDAYGRRASMTDGTGSQSYAYDDEDNSLSVATTYTGLSANTVSYSYWPNGSRQSMTTPVSSISYNYTYDAVGRMTGMTNPYGQTAAWSYLDNGWANQRTLSNAGTPVTVTSHYYDPRGELTGLRNRSASNATLSDYAGPVSGMVYDGAGNRTAWVSNIPAMSSYSRTVNYSYDVKNQVTQEASSAFNYTNGFGYDSAGNITSFKGGGHTYNADNQDAASTYDGNGNPTVYNASVYNGLSLAFDPENRMLRWGSVLSCGYNGDGLRAWKQNSSGARTYFVYDGSQPVCELNSNGTVVAVTDFGADGVWARHTTTTDWFYTFDPQGCLSQKIGRDGSVLCSSIYDAQGHEATTDTHPDPFSGYGGQWGYYADWETSGDNGGSCLYLLGHRFYDPDAGRFINRDPIGYRGGFNLYAYTGNNPVNRVDPNGTNVGVLLPVVGIIAPEVFIAIAVVTVVVVGVVLLVNKFPPENDPPWMNDPGSLRGRDPGGIVTEIPTEWGPGTPSSRGGGTVWRAPGRGGDGIRIMPGNPDVSIPEQRGPYCRVNKGGNLSDHIPLKGNPVLEGEEGGEGEQ